MKKAPKKSAKIHFVDRHIQSHPRWEEELQSQVKPLSTCAPTLDGVQESRVKRGRVGRLSAGSIQVVKHSYAASGHNLKCDLLIVDEAHRAKGEGTGFSRGLNRQKTFARRVLILTATPFSIRLEELNRMLTLIGAETEARAPVLSFSRALDDLYTGNPARSVNVTAEKLVSKAKAAVEAIRPFVIRHGITDLTREQSAFGHTDEWHIKVPSATCEEVEIMMRMDRALRVANAKGLEFSERTNDPRFHVGWRHLDAERDSLEGELLRLPEPARAVVQKHLSIIKELRGKAGTHPKMAAVAAGVETLIQQGEKVLVFCDHHATARELTAHLAQELPKIEAAQSPGVAVWRRAWEAALPPAADEPAKKRKLRATYIEWLCADLIRAQTWDWLLRQSQSNPSSIIPDLIRAQKWGWLRYGSTAGTAADTHLTKALKQSRARHHSGEETIAAAAHRLFNELCDSKSSKAVLREVEKRNRPELLPGANGALRVLGVCEPAGNEEEKPLFLHNQQPDTIISIFNSPFGPDVLVVTDKLSEGIDLHRYCRHLVHYELDPSPIRTIQRNGRLRRVNSWAAVIGEPILYAYPGFRGTRDHRLVQIMKKRIDSFSLLLGGVPEIKAVGDEPENEKWRNEVIAKARQGLVKMGGQLCAKDVEV